jgi:hypothetical protein
MVKSIVRIQLGIGLCGQPEWRSYDTEPGWGWDFNSSIAGIAETAKILKSQPIVGFTNLYF